MAGFDKLIAMRCLFRVLFAMQLVWPALLHAAPGDVDSDFGIAGMVTVGEHVLLNAVAVQTDGKIVVTGTTSAGADDEMLLRRYLGNGSPDLSFGSNGSAVLPAWTGDDSGVAVCIQQDGKLVVAGHGQTGTEKDFVIRRTLPDGTLDTAFGNNGSLVVDFGGSVDTCCGLATQADGRIIIAGTAGQQFAAARCLPDGTLDASFGSGGKVLVACPTGPASANALSLQPDGRIILAGSAVTVQAEDFALVRLLTDGSPDGTFGTNGWVLADLTPAPQWGINSRDYIHSLTVQPDGKIIAAGNYDFFVAQRFGMARFNANGTLDTSFGSGGRINAFEKEGTCKFLRLEENGSILSVSQYLGWFSNLDRFKPDGSVDARFVQGAIPTFPASQFDASSTSGSVMQIISPYYFGAKDAAADGDSWLIVIGSSSICRIDTRSHLEKWRQDHFGAGNSSFEASLAGDPDMDGVSNLLEFAFGSDPHSGSSRLVPDMRRNYGEPFELSYTAPSSVGGITYGAEWSTVLSGNPADWTAIPDTGGGGGWHRFVLPPGNYQHVFLRWRISIP
jgi:uncharacterized delta-60 repeat protein